ncbi:MAG: signal peptidase II [Clostridia bacterium]|jgi:signal peptidase II|nr:signal peptidase II [Clostridia bacterium]
MLFWTITLAVLALDRAVKYVVTANMQVGQSIPIIETFFHITFVKNPGAAFGILTDKRWFFVVVTIAILALLFYLAFTMGKNSKFTAVCLALICGGAIGNFIDRVASGLVTDYLDFRGIWPYIFNLADSAIVVGVILLAWQLIRDELKQEKPSEK